MDVGLALKINRLVHNECKDVPHDIGLRIEELVRLHQSELKNCSIPDVVGRSEQLPCGHKQVVLVRHAAKCKDCGTVFETEW
jgi:predicted Zn-ribbon and HTH transcriptional regulator